MTEKKVALITGISGQDAAFLSSQLLDKGWTVYGTCRDVLTTDFWRHKLLGVEGQINIIESQLHNAKALASQLRSVRPNHIYHLAGMSSIVHSRVKPLQVIEVNTIGTLNLLNAVKNEVPECRLFYASSSEVFAADSSTGSFDETSPVCPANPYGISKLAAQQFVRFFRESYELFTCSGILFNHESALRGADFLSRKITQQLTQFKYAQGKILELGNLDATRDWGAAEDFTKAMYKIMCLDKPEDYVVATGQLTSVREMLVCTASLLGYRPIFEGKGLNETCIDEKTGVLIAKVNPKFFRKQDYARTGNSNKLKSATNWSPKFNIIEVLTQMLEHDKQECGFS